MNCESQKCKKNMTTPHPCTKCLKKFCAKACMIDHFFETHLNETSHLSQLDLIPSKRRNSITSIFMKPGKYLKEFIPKQEYNFSNFEKVKSGTGKNPYYILGSGGFGDVYLCKHKQKKFYVAIKEMNKKKIMDAGHKLDLIYKEIMFNGRLLHENIIKLYSFWEDELNIYLVMEYADNGNLFGAIKKNTGFSESEAFSYFMQICSAVNFIHENNLIHRDLKPENILLCENENKIKLCDFGWCVELSVGNRSTFCGTYEYMAPEIIREKPYNHSIDVWSLGVLLYELLHGYSPFKAEVNMNDCYEVFDNIVKFNLKFEKELSDDCKDLIIKLLSPDIKSRIKVKEVFDHPWFRHFESIELEKIKANEQKRIPSQNVKLSAFDYNSNKKLDDNYDNNDKIIISNNKKVIVRNNKNKNSSCSSLIDIGNNINGESYPNPIDSYKSSMGFNHVSDNIPKTQNLVSLNSKNKLYLKDLKTDSQQDEINFNKDQRQIRSNNNSVMMGNHKLNEEDKLFNNLENNLFNAENELSTINNTNREYQINETLETPGQSGKTKIIIKKKKKILISKNSTCNEGIANKDLVINHLLKSSDNPFIENYKERKISSVVNTNKISKTSNKSDLANKSQLKNKSFIDTINDAKSNQYKFVDESIQLNKIKEKLNDSKIQSNKFNNFNFASEQIESRSKNKQSNKTANEMLIGSISSNDNFNLNKEEINEFNKNHEKYSNKNFNTHNKLNLDFNENGYDLENFIEKQNSKKSKIANLHSVICKTPNYKDGKLSEKFNSKANLDKKLLNNNFDEDSNLDNLNINKFRNDNFHNYDNEDNKFIKLIKLNNAGVNINKHDKSMDRSLNDISRDQIKDKINYKKNKSILNALNKTQNEIEKFDNNQMNSSVIDVVFSKIEGKKKNKNMHKEYDSKKKQNDNFKENIQEENDQFNPKEFNIRDYIKDNELKENEDFRLFKNDTEENYQNDDFYVTKNLNKLKLSDFPARRFHNSNDIEENDLTIKIKSNQSDISTTKKQQDKEDIFNIIPRDTFTNKYKNMQTNDLEVQKLIKNFQASPEISENNKPEFISNNTSNKAIDNLCPNKKSNSDKNNNEIFFSNLNHASNKSNYYAETPNPIDEELDIHNNRNSNRISRNSKSVERDSKSNEKVIKLPKDKKMVSSVIPSNNNDLLYSKDMKRDSNHNKYRKKLGEKSKLNSISLNYGNFDQSDENKVDLHNALELLEQANASKNNQVKNNESAEDNVSKWDKFINFINPFKCG